MASAICYLVPIVFSVVLLSCEAQEKIYPFEYIYQLGDSLSDTGNLIREGTTEETMAAAHLPYGESFHGEPTGRWSNGLLIIDFIVEKSTLMIPSLVVKVTSCQSVSFGVEDTWYMMKTPRCLNADIMCQVESTPQTICRRLQGQHVLDSEVPLVEGSEVPIVDSEVPLVEGSEEPLVDSEVPLVNSEVPLVPR
ncbi:unnamed protein product [Ilex paraguariensis]|uniref:Uncharacterized protein n=1 Tax=Ilex paraguariensis TaxID=185542 RepID=A0ABC8SBY5_9AQUA